MLRNSRVLEITSRSLTLSPNYNKHGRLRKLSSNAELKIRASLSNVSNSSMGGDNSPSLPSSSRTRAMSVDSYGRENNRTTPSLAISNCYSVMEQNATSHRVDKQINENITPTGDINESITPTSVIHESKTPTSDINLNSDTEETMSTNSGVNEPSDVVFQF